MGTGNRYFGKPVNRVDGQVKVTGEARYAAEFAAAGLLHGYIVNSTISRGTITDIDLAAALAVPGVVKIFTHQNRLKTAWLDLRYADMDAPPGSPFRPLHDGQVRYNGQPVALVVAENFETARYAASLVAIEYDIEQHHTDLQANLSEARKPASGMASMFKPGPPKPKGDAEKAFETAPVKASAEFRHGMEHHNPLELFATTVIPEKKGKLLIYDKTQGVVNTQLYVANVFGKAFSDVRVVSPYVGGAFGIALRPQQQLFLAVMAAIELKKPVRVTMNRRQMFTLGYRPETLQRTAYASDAAGNITAINHSAVAETSQFEDYSEVVVNWSSKVYPSPNVKLEQKVVALDVATPTDMRAPGGVTGIHPTECTIDELAWQARIDPVEFRLINYSDVDNISGKRWSSKELKRCLELAGEKFGWQARNPEPRSMKRDGKLIGWGVATGIWDAFHMPARAEAILTNEGKLVVKSATADIGTGTYTVMTQIAADCLGMDIDDVDFQLGDTAMPFAPIQGGSFTAASVGTAVQVACTGLRKKLLKQARKIRADLFGGLSDKDIEFADAGIRIKGTTDLSVPFSEIVSSTGKQCLTSKNTGLPRLLNQARYARAVHSAVFAEVEVDEDFGIVKVTRMVSAIAAGRIINPKTARSQIIGGMVWGISKALREESIMDHRYGRIVNANLGEYHIPVNADINELDVIFVEEEDPHINDLQIKGVGEIGIVGVPPAIANALFHATGRRFNDLPVTLDEVMRE